LAANQYALAVSSNNIANANDPNYSRQRLLTRPAGPDWGAWGIGRGVDIVGVESIRDMLVEGRWRHALSAKSNADTLAGRLGNLEALFNDSNGTSVLQTITKFFNSFQTLSQDPASLQFREQVKVSAGALIEAIHTRDRELKEMRAAADKNITWDVEQINRLTSQIADLTEQIRTEEIGVRSNDLRDRRIALIKELSQLVEVNELDSGDYQLTTKDNRLLVINATAVPLIAAQVTSGIGAGSLQAELEIRDIYVPKYLADLDQLAYEIAQQVNLIHSAAYDLDGNTNVNFFEPLTAVPGAARLISLSAAVAGDIRKIAASNLAAGNDNGAAIALANLLYAPVFSGGSVTDQYGALVFTIGSDVLAAQANMNEQEVVVTQLENRRQSISGVSIEEETLQISQFQRAYEASAQLVRAVDELLEATLGMLSR
jgi:flagellar hook-associated protein 1 FlgK